MVKKLKATPWFMRSNNRRLVDPDRVREAIVAAERRTSAELRVSLAPWFWGSVRHTADKAFVRLGMTKTHHRNGVLFFVVPSRRALVVLGDAGVHARVGQDLWNELAAIQADHFGRGEFTEGLIASIARAGEDLSLHFPADAERSAQFLPDSVA
jgi:uncharacterized membrane protein